MRIVSLLLLALTAALTGVASEPVAARRPNFIVINIDDLGYADIGPFGSKLNRTPNLDRMAQRGAEAHLLLRRAGLLAVARGADDRLLSEARAADSAACSFPRRPWA